MTGIIAVKLKKISTMAAMKQVDVFCTKKLIFIWCEYGLNVSLFYNVSHIYKANT